MSALSEVAAAGGRVWAVGEKLRYCLPKGRADLVDTLKAHKPEILAELRARDDALRDHCREACRGLSMWPEELLSALSEHDKRAILSDDPAELKALRTFAEGLSARLKVDKLSSNLHEAYGRLHQELENRTGIRFACEVLTPEADPVLLAVAVRGAGFATLRIAPERYDAGRLLEIIHRSNPAT